MESTLVVMSILLAAAFVMYKCTSKSKTCPHTASSAPSLLPWESVGGCGEGGSGGMSGDGIKWIGKGVSGGLVDVEVLPRYTVGRTYKTFSIAPRISFKPTWTTTMGVTLPFSSRQGMVQYKSNKPENHQITGGLGDISVDISRALGMSGQFSAAFSLTLPTGQYDIKRGTDHEMNFLPADLQMGGGVYNAGLSLEHTRDVEEGMWIWKISYNHPFNMKPFSEENEFLDEYFQDYAYRKSNRRFHYRFKPYGESDLGAYVPPSLSAAVYFSYSPSRHHVHSWGVNFSAPLGVAWIPSYRTTEYNPIPDPDHEAWRASFTYGLEFSRQKYPLFLAVSLPIHDRPGIDGSEESITDQWNAPDWEAFLNEWTLAFGFKSTMF